MNMTSCKDISGAYKLFFSTLANDSRLRILNALRHKTRNVTEICKDTGFEQSMVSHNLKELEYHGMVFLKKQGKYRYYSLNQKTIAPLIDLIDAHMKQYCCKILKAQERALVSPKMPQHFLRILEGKLEREHKRHE